ncbi:MAG: DUF3306 domain-containing protein [Geminicoccaceae bacterium]
MADRGRPTREQRDADQGFLRRWSRRKAEARSPATAPTQDTTASAECAPASLEQASEPEKGAPAAIDPKDLPDIESLDASSDFTVFMRPGVPEHLRTLALRKLWRSDPIFSKLDGLVEYGEDYTIQSWPKGVIKTAYRIGRGFVDELEKLAEAAAQSKPPQAPVTGPEPESGAAVAAAGTKPAAAAPADPPPPEPASPRESGSPQQGPAQPAKRRRRLPGRS